MFQIPPPLVIGVSDRMDEDPRCASFDMWTPTLRSHKKIFDSGFWAVQGVSGSEDSVNWAFLWYYSHAIRSMGADCDMGIMFTRIL